MYTAVIKRIKKISNNVKLFKLSIEDPTFLYNAGQWIDAFVPNTNLVGGYSICSTPDEYQRLREIKLFIKESSYPPTKWFYNKASIDLSFKVAVGGKMIIDNINIDNLIFIAGGIGINPLITMIKDIFERNFNYNLYLYYGIKNHKDFLYRGDIEALSSKSNFQAQIFFSQENKDYNDNTAPSIDHIYGRRMTLNDITKHVPFSNFSQVNISKYTFYICGPPSMIQHFIDDLQKENVPLTNIHFEQWQ